MKEKIYPVNFEINVEFIVGPNLQVPVTPVLIQANKIIGFDFIQACEDLRPIMCNPVPIVIESNGLYIPTLDLDYWKPDLSGAESSHILCLLIKSDIDENTRQQVISILSHVHANRTSTSKKDLFEQVDKNTLLKEHIKSVYGIDDLFHGEKGLSHLLGANGYVKTPQRRNLYKAKHSSLDNSIEIPVDISNEILEKSWNEFARKNYGVLRFSEIITAATATATATSEKVRNRLYQLIRECEDLMKVWEKVSNGLNTERQLQHQNTDDNNNNEPPMLE